MNIAGEFLDAVVGNVGENIFGLVDEQALVIEQHGAYVQTVKGPTSKVNGCLQGVFAKHKVFMAVPDGDIECHQLGSGELVWSATVRATVLSMVHFPKEGVLIVSGDKRSTSLSTQDGRVVVSPHLNYHSHRAAGQGCICIHRESGTFFFFEDLRTKIELTNSISVRLAKRFGAATVACSPFGKAIVYLFGTKDGGQTAEVEIPDCSVIDTIDEDSNGDLLALCFHSHSKRYEVWRITEVGTSNLVSRLPEGIGQVGWSFHKNSSVLVSRGGKLVDVSTGRLLEAGWIRGK